MVYAIINGIQLILDVPFYQWIQNDLNGDLIIKYFKDEIWRYL